MKSKEEILKWLLENCLNSNDNLDLKNLDFGDFEGDIMISGIRCKGDIIQNGHENQGDVNQQCHENNGDIHQDYQENKGNIYQSHQENQGNIYQSYQENDGNINQISHNNKGDIFTDSGDIISDLESKLNTIKLQNTKLEEDYSELSNHEYKQRTELINLKNKYLELLEYSFNLQKYVTENDSEKYIDLLNKLSKENEEMSLNIKELESTIELYNNN